jgi:ABC-type transport system involved in multi-copper enzyme maturation permease subunit
VLGRIWAIALNTFREAARIKVLYGILVVVLGANLLAMVLGTMSIREAARTARDVGLAGMSLFGSLTAIFLGVFLLYTEVQRRTIHAIVSKPIERWEFVVGKYAGMALVLTLLAGLFAVTTIGQLVYQGVGIGDALVKAMLLTWMEILLVAAIAVFFSSFSSPFLSGLFALAVWVIGRVTPDLQAAASVAKSEWIRVTAKGALNIVPDVHLFVVSGRVVEGHHATVHGDFVSWGYVGMSAGHGALWIAGLLAFAAVLFHRRDFV